ncbi:hypothetical protein [Dankookia sp. P2]|uniref:hypothetical protein n=1 Tax=Dankookia sp. P2 TaxID=3423955 RepID=UPI003D66D8DD
MQLASGGAVIRDPAPRPADGFAGIIATRLRLGPGTPVAAFDAAVLAPFRDRDIPAQAVPTGALSALRLREALPPPVLLLAGPLLATAPDLADALAGVRALLAPGGVAVFDIPDLMARLAANRFDLLGHAVPALPSLLVAEMLLWQHGLVLFEVRSLPGPGPWLRLLVRHEEDATKPVAGTVLMRREAERAAGLEGPAAYHRAAVAVAEARLAVLDLLVGARREGRVVAGYGAGSAAATLAAATGAWPRPARLHRASGGRGGRARAAGQPSADPAARRPGRGAAGPDAGAGRHPGTGSAGGAHSPMPLERSAGAAAARTDNRLSEIPGRPSGLRAVTFHSPGTKPG